MTCIRCQLPYIVTFKLRRKILGCVRKQRVIIVFICALEWQATQLEFDAFHEWMVIYYSY